MISLERTLLSLVLTAVRRQIQTSTCKGPNNSSYSLEGGTGFKQSPVKTLSRGDRQNFSVYIKKQLVVDQKLVPCVVHF